MAAPTALKPEGFPSGHVTLPNDGSPSTSFDAGASFDITKPKVEMVVSLPPESNVTFGNGSKELEKVSREFGSLGRQELKRPITLAAPAGVEPDTNVSITVRVNYKDDPQTAPTAGRVKVKRPGGVMMAAAVAGGVALTATAIAIGEGARRRALRKDAQTKTRKAPATAAKASSSRTGTKKKSAGKKSPGRRANG